jgi:hypothetical protein
VLQKFDLLSDRRGSVIDELGQVRFVGTFEHDVQADLRPPGHYSDDRVQVFFHNRYPKETTPAAEIRAAGWYGRTGSV